MHEGPFISTRKQEENQSCKRTCTEPFHWLKIEFIRAAFQHAIGDGTKTMKAKRPYADVPGWSREQEEPCVEGHFCERRKIK
jgi:hypothetical protein